MHSYSNARMNRAGLTGIRLCMCVLLPQVSPCRAQHLYLDRNQTWGEIQIKQKYDDVGCWGAATDL